MAHKFENHVIQKHHILVEVVVETTANRVEAFQAIKRGIFRGLDTPPTMIAAPDKVSISNVEPGCDWLDTYAYLCSEIGIRLGQDDEEISNIVSKHGRFELNRLAFDLTNEFEDTHKGRQWNEWNGEWFDEIDSFLNAKLK